MLALPMTTDGVEVRPLRQITGDSEFNQVFLDRVEVPTANLVGPEHAGWAVANTTLANERGASFIWKEQVFHELAIRRLWRRCRRSGRFADPVVRQELAQAWMEVEILRLHNARTLARLDRGESIGPEASLVKLWWAGMSQRLADAAPDVLGPGALLMPEDRHALDGGRWAHALLATRANSIMGGTSEIQRTILGEQLLGLPREPSR
jgi:alkylation response protein AidB-like acyl-CoA dehydrogenase